MPLVPLSTIWDTESYAFRKLTVTLGCAHTPSECMLTILNVTTLPSTANPIVCTLSLPVEIDSTELIARPSLSGTVSARSVT